MGACAGATINADFVSEISCKDDNACAGTTITVTSAAEDFEVECGENSCVGLTLTASVASDVKGFKCGEGGCIGATFGLTTVNGANIQVETIDCDGDASCENESFNFEYPYFSIDECKCGEIGEEDYGCNGVTGLDIVSEDKCTAVEIIVSYAQAVVQDEDSGNTDDDLLGLTSGENTLKIELSSSALMNLWLMVAVCLFGNALAYWCFCRGPKTSVSIGPNGGAHDQYISDQ